MSDRTIAAARELLAEKFGDRARDSFIADPHVQRDAAGGAIVYFHQQYAGLQFFEGTIAVHLADRKVSGRFFDVDAVSCVPLISAVDATEAALKHFRARTDRSMCQVAHRSYRGSNAVPVIRSSFPLPSKPTVLALPRSKALPVAHLEIFESRLVWVVRLQMRIHAYLLLVTATGEDAGRVLFCTQWSSGARCTGRAFGFDFDAGLVDSDFPVAPGLFPAPLLTPASQELLRDWIDVDRTEGNNVATFSGIARTTVRAVNGVFPAALSTRDQALLSVFFFCNYLHDFFLLLGFGEAEGNFQARNFSGVAGNRDELHVQVFETNFGRDLGSMQARVDGQPPIMMLGNANNQRVALRAEVVIHEYVHGVTQRMVGGLRGAASLTRAQSLALSEAWSDYFAITLRNHHLHPRTNYRFAEWSGANPPTRSAAYDAAYPGHFGLLGRAPHADPHGAGEVFAVALIRFNEFLGERLGDATLGHCLGWRAVIESLRHVPVINPTLLEGRDALFTSIDKLEGHGFTPAQAQDARTSASRAFARYGMGPAARGPQSDRFGPTTPDPPM